MAQRFKDEAGNIWEMGPNGQPSLVSHAAGQSLANPKLPGELQAQTLDIRGKQADLAKSPYQLRQEAAQAAQAELNLKTAQEQYDAQHPKVSTNGLYGEDYLKTLPKSEQGIIKALTEGRLAFPNGAGMRSPAWMQKLQEVAQYDPTFDATNFNARAKGRASAISGKLGAANNALNTAVGHLGTLYSQIDGTASHGGFPFATTVNSVENAYRKGHGDPGVTNFTDTASKLADELEAVYRNGGGAEQGVTRQLRNLDPNMSRDQKVGIVNNAVDLLASKMAANLAQYNFGTGGKPTWDMLDPHAREVLQKIAPGSIQKYFAAPANDAASTPPSIGPDQQAQFFKVLQEQGPEAADAYLQQFGLAMQDKTAANRPYSQSLAPADSYANSYLGQGLSGANEGLASTLGAPADLMRGALNLIPKGINAVANTNIPMLPEPIGGGQWFKNRLSDLGSIQDPSADPSKQFTRRVGESVGASAVPGMFGGSLPRMGAALLSGLGSGVGAATAQQVAPGNQLAEMAGDVIGGGLTGLGLARTAQRSAQRAIEANVPTVADLKTEASGLYKKAEQNGVVAAPDQTSQLASDFHNILRQEGQIGPKGSITNADTNITKAHNLIQQYAGREMKPSEMNTIRKVLGDSRQSADPADRRLGNILLDHFDNWVSPMAPEFDKARSVSSRYLQTQDLERARELAGARASQFTGSGFENALRTEYRGLDRGNIKGQNHFAPDVTDAIQTVARGTPLSNTMRGLGRLAPTGPVAGMGSLIPGLAAGGMFGGHAGAGVGAGLASLGIAGRIGATRMGVNAADQAELIARNGGKLQQAPLLPKELQDYIAMLAASQQAKYLSQN